MPLRVLHLGKFFPPHHGGMEVFLAELIAAQHAQGIEAAAIVHGAPQADDPTWLVRVPVQAQLIYAPIALGFRADLAKAIERFRPDVLHLHMPNTSVFWALTLAIARDIPWVVHWHADVVASKISKALAVAYTVYRPFEQAVLDRADRIIATSLPYMTASLPLAPWSDKCAVIPLGLDATALPDVQPSTSQHRLPWRPGLLRLLSIGRLTYYKGFDTLIQVLADLPGVELVIVGAGELQPRLEALIRATTPPGLEPAVQLIGAVDDDFKHALLDSCDVFCLASVERTEAFGMVLLEAMAHAKPCLVSDLPGSGMPWLVKKADAGLLVPVDDISAWRSAVNRLHHEAQARESWGVNGRLAVQKTFSIATVAQAIELQYLRVAPASVGLRPGHETLVVIPAKDEALTIGPLIAALRAKGWMHVLVIDDQSRDETGVLASAAGAQVLQPLLPLGAWGAMQAGIQYGLAKGYKAVVTMDADGQHEVDELPKLMASRSCADVVIGAFPARASAARRLAWFWFRTLAGFDLHDLTSGFRLYNRQAMKVLASHEATLLDYQDVGTLLMLRKAGLSVTEVPVAMNMRLSGKSRIFSSWTHVARYMAVTTLLCLSQWRVKR